MENGYMKVLRKIEKQTLRMPLPYVTKISKKRKDPFRVLVSCILSLRTKDEVTTKASEALFKIVKKPQDILKLKTSQIAKIIYPVGFYRNKARVLRGIAYRVINKYKGKVPSCLEELLSFNGVGRKTANLVLGLGFGIPAICVDTHVHRISNRLGWVRTDFPYDTEEVLKRIIVQSRWIKLNTVFVAFGQNICLPVSPWCGRCNVNSYCPKIGVKRHR